MLKQMTLCTLLGAMTSAPTVSAADADNGPAVCSITQWLAARSMARKKGGAEMLNDSHRAYEAKGYKVLDVEIYIENGDMQGFFVTYQKIEGCQKMRPPAAPAPEDG